MWSAKMDTKGRLCNHRGLNDPQRCNNHITHSRLICVSVSTKRQMESATLEEEGELKRIKAKVDWNLELAHVARKVLGQRGQALLFENIKDHENTRGRRLFINSMAKRSRLALMLGPPKEAKREELIRVARKRFSERIKPVMVKTGPVKENIVKGDEVDLFQFPVHKDNLVIL